MRIALRRKDSSYFVLFVLFSSSILLNKNPRFGFHPSLIVLMVKIHMASRNTYFIIYARFAQTSKNERYGQPIKMLTGSPGSTFRVYQVEGRLVTRGFTKGKDSFESISTRVEAPQEQVDSPKSAPRAPFLKFEIEQDTS